MLAAGYGEDILRLFLKGVVKSVVGGRVTGVERDNHIYLFLIQNVSGHIRVNKAKIMIAVLLRHLIAMLHHVRLQVITDYLRLHAFFDSEVVIEHKGQV